MLYSKIGEKKYTRYLYACVCNRYVKYTVYYI